MPQPVESHRACLANLASDVYFNPPMRQPRRCAPNESLQHGSAVEGNGQDDTFLHQGCTTASGRLEQLPGSNMGRATQTQVSMVQACKTPSPYIASCSSLQGKGTGPRTPKYLSGGTCHKWSSCRTRTHLSFHLQSLKTADKEIMRESGRKG